MLNATRGKKSNNTQLSQSKAMNLSAFAAALTDFEMKIYGAGGAPLYDIVTIYGEVTPLNRVETSFHSFNEIKENLSEGEAGYSYSAEYEQFTLALCVPNGGIVFASLLHDKEGKPKTADSLVLCKVKANRDFELDGDTIIKKGQELFKALPEPYAMKLNKAA